MNILSALVKKEILNNLFNVSILISLLFIIPVFAWPAKPYITYIFNWNDSLLHRSEIVVDSARAATKAELQAASDSVRAWGWAASEYFLDDIYINRVPPADPGYILFFTNLYPPVHITGLYDDGMCGYDICMYEVYGDTIGFFPGQDSLIAEDFTFYPISVSHCDTALVQHVFLNKVHKDPVLAAWKGKDIRIYGYRNDPVPYHPADVRNTLLNYLFIATYDITPSDTRINVPYTGRKPFFKARHFPDAALYSLQGRYVKGMVRPGCYIMVSAGQVRKVLVLE